MVDKEIQTLRGMNALLYVRLLSNADKEDGQLIPMQTSLTFDPKRKSNSKATKSGNVSTISSIDTDLETEFVDNVSKISDDLYTSLLENEKVEVWKVNKDRVNEKGQYYAWYMRGTVTEDSNDNDADDNSKRDVTFSVDGTPKRGWLTLPESAQEELDYVFRGLGAASSGDLTGKGAAWTTADVGKGSDTAPAKGLEK